MLFYPTILTLIFYLYFQYNVCCCAPTRHSKFPVSENLLGSKSVSCASIYIWKLYCCFQDLELNLKTTYSNDCKVKLLAADAAHRTWRTLLLVQSLRKSYIKCPVDGDIWSVWLQFTVSLKLTEQESTSLVPESKYRQKKKKKLWWEKLLGF